MTNVGAAVSSLFGGVLNSKFGRKYTILGSSLLFICGAVLCAASPDKDVLLVGRILLGVAIGK
jgi:predicted MFS family arabinose efflux permease